ncbi:MAG TPA: DNA replication protein [Thalassobaculum sp.]
MSAAQLTLDLGHRPALGRGDFLVSACNAEAAAWIDRWPDWPAPLRGLAIVGPPGCGKTHLGAVWRQASGAVALNAADLTVDGVPAALGDAVDAVVDDLTGLRRPQALLHLYNTVAERRGSVLILSRAAPARQDFGLPDLASRLATLPVAMVGAPDEVLLAGILAKHFADRQVAVREEVVAYLVTRMERSFAAADRLVDRIDRLALAEGRRVDRVLARRVLAEEDDEGETGFDREE